MRHIFMHHFLIAIQAEVVPLCDDIGFGHTEALRSARSLALFAIAVLPASKNVWQIILGVLIFREFGFWQRSELAFTQQRRALVIQRPAIGINVVKPNIVSAAGLRLGEQQNSDRNFGIELK